MVTERAVFPLALPQTYRSIRDYSLIGDCRTSALVAADGSIDWCCLPHFDSSAVLSRLVSTTRGGYLDLVDPLTWVMPIPIIQRYIPNTAILQTEVLLGEQRLLMTDFMPTEHLRTPESSEFPPRIIRRIESIDGVCQVALRFKPTPDYGRVSPYLTSNDDGVMVTIPSEPGVTILCLAETALSGDIDETSDGAFVSVQLLQPNHPLTAILTWAANPFQANKIRRSLRRDWTNEMEATRIFWQGWASRSNYDGPFREIVSRSAITLKLLTFAPTGAMVAAPTTSLPETIGGSRNWDYRYTWIRDSTLAAGVLSSLGYFEEATAFINWVEHRERRSDRELRVMYGIHGERQLPEMEIAPFEGYRASRPVRIGNKAVEQNQLDIYGEWLDCVARYAAHPQTPPLDPWLWSLVESMVSYVCDHWMLPDVGIWEMRSVPQHFVYSKVMCWVALDRGISLAERYGYVKNLNQWRTIREQIHHDVTRHGLNPATGGFQISYEDHGLDAATLMIPLVGFLPPTDPRVVATREAIVKELTDANGFVYRYLQFDDGVGGDEGTFVICTCWLAEHYALEGQRAKAIALFEKLLGCVSQTGLVSEMIDSPTGELLGNYPQAFSHLGLIRVALALQQHDEEKDIEPRISH